MLLVKKNIRKLIVFFKIMRNILYFYLENWILWNVVDFFMFFFIDGIYDIGSIIIFEVVKEFFLLIVLIIGFMSCILDYFFYMVMIMNDSFSIFKFLIVNVVVG